MRGEKHVAWFTRSQTFVVRDETEKRKKKKEKRKKKKIKKKKIKKKRIKN